ncbi:MAG: hypothetical protein WBC92_13675, partial [Terracidiphilus sp.]
MAYLIAADVIVQAERKRLDLDAWLRGHPNDEIKLAAITVAELWHSVEHATGVRRAKRENFVQSALKVFEVAPYSEKAAAEHARLWA